LNESKPDLSPPALVLGEVPDAPVAIPGFTNLV
jgi:hypothetical protein